MEATYEDGRVLVENDARQQLYDAGGFGEPLGGDSVALTYTEAAYLLGEGKLSDVDGDDYAAVARRVDCDAVLRAYADLRDRGYYLSHSDSLYLYDRGDHPANSSPETRVGVADERGFVEIVSLPSLVAVTDDDGDVTYFRVEEVEPRGDFSGIPEVDGIPDDRHVYDESVAGTLREARYGAERDDGALVLSPVEAAYLGREGAEAAEDKRLAVYADLRDRGVCPRTGFKFGADFRVYETTDDDHAGLLVSALDHDSSIPVVELSRYVRLAHGVRKRAVFGLVGEGVEYVAVERERP